jgi:TRAP-type C4-dicarboxylate transport system permease small subunit
MIMKAFERMIKRASNQLAFLSGVILCFTMCISVADVILRNLGMPFMGVYELVSIFGGLLAGFALPHSFFQKAHVRVDMVVEKLPPLIQAALEKITRVLVLLFIFIAIYFLLKMAWNLANTNTVSATLGVPMYPVAFGLVAGCLVACLILVYELFSPRKGISNE